MREDGIAVIYGRPADLFEVALIFASNTANIAPKYYAIKCNLQYRIFMRAIRALPDLSRARARMINGPNTKGRIAESHDESLSRN